MAARRRLSAAARRRSCEGTSCWEKTCRKATDSSERQDPVQVERVPDISDVPFGGASCATRKQRRRTKRMRHRLSGRQAELQAPQGNNNNNNDNSSHQGKQDRMRHSRAASLPGRLTRRNTACEADYTVAAMMGTPSRVGAKVSRGGRKSIVRRDHRVKRQASSAATTTAHGPGDTSSMVLKEGRCGDLVQEWKHMCGDWSMEGQRVGGHGTVQLPNEDSLGDQVMKLTV